MLCEFCGEEVSQGALACPRCGSPVSPAAAQEKSATPPPSADSPHPPTGAPAQRPPAPIPQSPPAQSPQSDAGLVLPDAPGGGPPASIPPWEIQAPAPDPTQLSYQAQPEQALHYEPPQVPLAKQEEDFIALAEEKARLEELDALPPDSTTEIPGANGALSPEAAIIESSVAPGPDTNPEGVVVENGLTGGHNGGAFTGASVAGAGAQTADDPFGLKVTETAPPTAVEQEAGKQFNWAKWHNILMMIVAFLVAGAVAATGIYFGFLRKQTAPTTDPVGTVNKFCTQIISGDTSKLSEVSLPGSSYQKELSNVIEPYAKLGVLSLKDFEATATEVKDTNATVEIEKLVVKSLNSEGKVEYLDLLSIHNPAPFRTTVSLIKQNGKWLVSN